MQEVQEVEREFWGGFMGFSSFFKRPELFKAGLLLLEMLLVQRCPTSALLCLAWCKEANGSRPLQPLYMKVGVRCSNYKCS